MGDHPTPQLGITFLPWWPPERLLSVATAADRAGLGEFWLWEDCFKQAGASTAGAVLARTDRVRVGVGLFPAPLRNPALLAMEIAGLDRMFPGRFLGAVGHGVQDWMRQVGAKAASPVTLLREYLTAVRSLLDGDTVTVDGRYVHLDAVALDHPPTGRATLFAGAGGPKSLALCAELADGTLVSGFRPPSTTREVRELADRVRSAAGLDPAHEIITSVPVATGPDAAERMERERLAWEAEPADGISVIGTADEIADGLRRFVEAGATSIAVQPTRDEPDPEGLAAFLGAEVAPLLR
ncbi:LLM class flavin-dependent oxidoreductase [Nakamurella sp. YIM 132087]|uniref:LLM class flavin-dependent oxidoreductase n=1 Tax=Nakamurella alba TaxID=2665158 RepID=A0A7K1FUB1_9ACTN|nr:LLM class flavin-dependent oxidoreductase [Nakamurella alba]MTD16939.1 LLM class flavin-dependent oxidoreductase [Nakamurella alba]